MRRIVRACLLLSIAAVGSISAVPGWSVSEDGARQSLDILIEQLEGQVDVSSKGQESIVAIGDALALPSRIVTGGDGSIVLRQGRTGVHIERESDVEIPEAAAHGQLIARMIQHRGSAFYDVEPRPLEQLRLTVETPYLVAVVKGTQFNVAVVDGATTISLHEGTLEVRSPDGLQSIELNAGEIAIRSLTDGTIRRLPMDPDRLDEIARADGLDAAGAAARTARTGIASGDVVVVAAGSASIPTGGSLDGTTARVATEIESTGGDPAKIGGSLTLGGTAPLGAQLDASVGIATGTALGSAADVRLDTGAAVDVDLGGGSVDLGLDAGLDTGVDLGGGSVDVGLDAGLDTGVDLGGSSVDVGLDAGLDTGIDLGGGSVDLGLDAGLDTGIDLGGTGLDTGLDLGIDTDLSADLGSGLDTGLDIGLDTSIDTGLDTGLDLGVDLGVDLGIDTDSGLDLGLDGAVSPSGSGSSGGTDQSGGGGLLGGLVGPLL